MQQGLFLLVGVNGLAGQMWVDCSSEGAKMGFARNLQAKPNKAVICEVKLCTRYRTRVFDMGDHF
jgi:hypothetical protein